MREEILNTKNQAIAQITESKDTDDLENLRIQFLGRNGKIASFIKRLKRWRLKKTSSKNMSASGLIRQYPA